MLATRRNFLKSSLAGTALSAFGVGLALAQDDNWLDLKTDSGDAVTNFKLPSEISAEGLRGILWTGSETADVILLEFFDYNCPYCKRAVGDLDVILKTDTNFKLGLINNSVLGIASAQAAKVQQAVLKLFGPKRAYDFHVRLFAHRGVNDGAAAMQVVKDMGLDEARIWGTADAPDIQMVLGQQMRLASELGFVATPSFMLDGIGILGYPGPNSVAKMIWSVRSCDKPAC